MSGAPTSRETSMTLERFNGICLQIAGRLNEALGELTGDPARRAEGQRTRINAIWQQRKALDKEESARQLRDFVQRNRNWHF
jgi:uncharacterized protein YjbJ (UPF0337 family)